MIGSVYILAGGKSSRFGSNKARALINGQPLIVHQAAKWKQIGSKVTVVAQSTQEYSDLGLKTICDKKPDSGPVVGVFTALEHFSSHTDEKWAMITTCDMVGEIPEAVGLLVPEISTSRLVVIGRDDRLQPFPGLYHRDALAIASECISSKQSPSMRELLDLFGERLESRPIEHRPWASVNTVQELADWLDEAR